MLKNSNPPLEIVLHEKLSEEEVHLIISTAPTNSFFVLHEDLNKKLDIVLNKLFELQRNHQLPPTSAVINQKELSLSSLVNFTLDFLIKNEPVFHISFIPGKELSQDDQKRVLTLNQVIKEYLDSFPLRTLFSSTSDGVDQLIEEHLQLLKYCEQQRQLIEDLQYKLYQQDFMINNLVRQSLQMPTTNNYNPTLLNHNYQPTSMPSIQSLTPHTLVHFTNDNQEAYTTPPSFSFQ